MGRKKILKKNKNHPISVSLTPRQIKFLEEHPSFSISKFVQMMIDDHVISLADDLNKIRKEDK